MKKINASLIATGLGAALAVALSGPALASGNDIHHVADSALATNHASATSVQLGDVSVGIYSASAALNGTVQGSNTSGIEGNYGGDGGSAGSGGVGNNGGASAHSHSSAVGGDGGNGGLGSGGATSGAVSSGALAMAATGNGALGGNGGSANGGPAGSFVVSNSIANSSFASAAGIMNVSQNMGANALTQQGVTVQGNVSFK